MKKKRKGKGIAILLIIEIMTIGLAIGAVAYSTYKIDNYRKTVREEINQTFEEFKEEMLKEIETTNNDTKSRLNKFQKKIDKINKKVTEFENRVSRLELE